MYSDSELIQYTNLLQAQIALVDGAIEQAITTRQELIQCDTSATSSKVSLDASVFNTIQQHGASKQQIANACNIARQLAMATTQRSHLADRIVATYHKLQLLLGRLHAHCVANCLLIGAHHRTMNYIFQACLEEPRYLCATGISTQTFLNRVDAQW